MPSTSKYLIHILFVAVFAFSGQFHAQQNKIDEKGRKQGVWLKLYDGEYSDKVRYQGQFKDDKPIGKFVYYYPTGQIMAVITHEVNTNRSEGYFYHENKELASFGIYKNQEKDSVWINFNEYGFYSSQETYKNGKLDGERLLFYGAEATNNEKIKLILRKENYKDGVTDGKFEEYFADGVLKTEGTYSNGKREGVIKKYHPNGRILFIERWKDGRKHGWWQTFDEGGKEVGRKYYKNGLSLEGEELENYLKKIKDKGISPNE